VVRSTKRDEVQVLRAVRELAREIGLEQDLAPLLGRVLETCLRLVGAERGAIVTASMTVLHPVGQRLELAELTPVPLRHDGEFLGSLYIDVEADELVEALACEAALAIARVRQIQVRLDDVTRGVAVAKLAREIAHDFNNLLCVISSYAVLLEETASTPEVQSDAHAITTAANSAAALARTLLAAARETTISS
jgi:hypothetical protein